MWRICPLCGTRTNDDACPEDGERTALIEAGTPFPGKLPPGTTVHDNFVVERLVGVGGMGAVYRGTHNVTGQPVAIKVLWRDLAGDKLEVRRFTREARAASTLAHPNTVRVFDFGELPDADDGTPGSLYMVMEFLKGQKLSDVLLDEHALEPGRVVHIVTQICKALEEAHAHGLVHRDVKPDNVFLQEIAGERDFAKLLDFGLAKFVAGKVERDRLTRAGFVVGSPEYMAPEQAMGGQVGPEADIYALGILTYECLTGDLPFNAATTSEVLRKHIMDSPPAMDGPYGEVPERLQHVVMRCLSKEPSQRYSSAEELRIAMLKAYDRRGRRLAADPAPQVSAPTATAGPGGVGEDTTPDRPAVSLQGPTLKVPVVDHGADEPSQPVVAATGPAVGEYFPVDSKPDRPAASKDESGATPGDEAAPQRQRPQHSGSVERARAEAAARSSALADEALVQARAGKRGGPAVSGWVIVGAAAALLLGAALVWMSWV